MKWFRHYVGMTRDDKLMAVAAKSRQPLDRVMFVWIALLESASECEDGGRYAVDAEMVAYTIRCEPSDISAIMRALEVAGRTSEGVVTHWKDRQFESDTSRDRMRRHRSRENGGGNGQKPHSDGTKKCGDDTVTSQNRTVTPPETETDIPSPSGDRRPAADDPQPQLFGSEPQRPELRVVDGEVIAPRKSSAEVRDPPIDSDAAYYRRGREVLGDGHGAMLTKLKRHFGGNVADARAVIEHAATRDGELAYVAGVLAKPSRAGPTARPTPHNPRLAASRQLAERLDEIRSF